MTFFTELVRREVPISVISPGVLIETDLACGLCFPFCESLWEAVALVIDPHLPWGRSIQYVGEHLH